MPNGVGAPELIILLIIAAMLVVPAVIVVMLVLSIAARSSEGTRPDPRAVLAERLANGQITRAEFDAAMRALGFAD
jgi:uncharacterized membrane protein